MFGRKKKEVAETTVGIQGHEITVNPTPRSPRSIHRNKLRAERLRIALQKQEAKGAPEEILQSLRRELKRREFVLEEFEAKGGKL